MVVELFQNEWISRFQRHLLFKLKLLAWVINILTLDNLLFWKLVVRLINNYFCFFLIVLYRKWNLTNFYLRFILFDHIDMIVWCCCPNALVSSLVRPSWWRGRIFMPIEGELEHILVLSLNLNAFSWFELNFGSFSLWVVKC